MTNLYDTKIVLVLTNTAFALPMSTWLLKGYIDSISPVIGKVEDYGYYRGEQIDGICLILHGANQAVT